MKGDLVIVRALEGPLVRRVEELNGKTVFISSEEQYELRAKGLPALDAVGFPREHVFEYDPKFEEEIARGKVEWHRLTPYKAQGEGPSEAWTGSAEPAPQAGLRPTSRRRDLRR